MRIGSLFSGIGGLELGLEMSGLGHTVWQVESDFFCRRVLAKHWPEVKRYDDVREVGAAILEPVDLICGGFPCQDISGAGKGAGLAGSRSGLWFEFARIVSELRPSWVVVENVASGANRWVDAIREHLAGLGYETLPIPLSARDVGAPHLRRRVFVVGYSDRDGQSTQSEHEEVARVQGDSGSVADADSRRCGKDGVGRSVEKVEGAGPQIELQVAECNPHAANPIGEQLREQSRRSGGQGWSGAGVAGDVGTEGEVANAAVSRSQWKVPKPALCRVDDGPAAWLDRNPRIKALGNAVVPQCAEVIGHVIKELMR